MPCSNNDSNTMCHMSDSPKPSPAFQVFNRIEMIPNKTLEGGLEDDETPSGDLMMKVDGS